MTNRDTRMQERLHWKGGQSEKWKVRKVTLNKQGANGAYVLTITNVNNNLSKMLGPSKSSKATAVELGPGTHAVLHFSEFDGRKNVLGLVQVDKDGSQMLFSCDCSIVFTQLKHTVQKCCNGDSFQVIIGADQIFSEGQAVLHVFQDQLRLFAYKRNTLVVPIGQWTIVSQEQIELVENGVMLNIGRSSGRAHWLVLNTEEGQKIISLFYRHVDYQYLPVRAESCSTCDTNCNQEVWVPRSQENPTPNVDGSFSPPTTDKAPSPHNSISTPPAEIARKHTVASKEQAQLVEETVMALDSNQNLICEYDDQDPRNRPEENIINISGAEQINLANETRTENSNKSGFNKDECNRHPPTCYVYMNQISEICFKSGTSIKHCYENLKYNNDQQGPPPIHPRRKVPEVPPRGCNRPSTFEVSPLTPPKRPPKAPAVPQRPSHLHPQVHHPQVQVAVFASACIPGNYRYWFLRVAVMCKDHDDATIRRVKDHEAQSNHHFLKSQPLLVQSDIKIALHGLSAGFECVSENFQCVEFGDVKNLRPGDWFVIEYHLLNNGTEQFFGKVYVGPPSGPSDCDLQCGANRRLNIGVSESFVMVPTNAHSEELQIKPTPTSGRPHQSVLSNYEKRKAICQALDVTLYTENNWKRVAAKLNISVSKIHELDDKAHRSHDYSPMEVVFQMWEQGEPDSCSWEALKDILRDIDRQDIIQDIDKQK